MMNDTQRQLLELINKGGIGVEYDNYGQLVIYTGLYEDEDGKITTTNPEEE